MRSAIRFSVLAIGLLAMLATVLVAVHAADSPNSIAIRKQQRQAERHRQSQQFKNEVNRGWLREHVAKPPTAPKIEEFDKPIVKYDPTRKHEHGLVGATPPPESPGAEIGFSSIDYQADGSQGYNVARTPAGERVHFTWHSYKYIPNSEYWDQYVVYYGYQEPNNYPCDACWYYGGMEITGASYGAGNCGIDVDYLNHAQVAYHAHDDQWYDHFEPWYTQFPFGDDTYQTWILNIYDNSCPGFGEEVGVLWPRLTADRSDSILHEIAHTNVLGCPDNHLWYWRFDGVTTWHGPALIGNTPDITYALAADAGSDKVAIVTHETVGDFTEVAYIESAADGTDWLALVPNVDPMPQKQFVTNYAAQTPPDAHTAFMHLTTTYDNSSALHIMWDEQENSESEHIAIKHWNSQRGTIRTVTLGYWDRAFSSGLFNLNLAKLSMGIGDGSTTCGGGSNNNYVYCTYTQFGGNTPAEQEDHSSENSVPGRRGGYMNGEIYLTISNSGGNTWSPPVNLTNTKTPNCNPGLADWHTGIPANPDSVCRSEHWATIGRVVKDLDIFFISDLDAGGIIQGEGSWQLNPVHYLRLSGSGIAPAGICPLIAPVFEAMLQRDPECEFHAPRSGAATTPLTIINLGNATLNQGLGNGIEITDFPGLPSLTLDGPTGNYAIPDGSPDMVRTVMMASNGAAGGLYLGQISISHNDANKLSPRLFPIEFFVYDDFDCPQDALLKTGVASPGSLQLKVESTGRFASGHDEGGLWRHSDSSSSIFDASLLLAHGSQGADTTVFHHFYNRLSNGQNGFRSQSNLYIDTTWYSSGQEYAAAGAYLTARDSVIGINMSWYFPQGYTSDEVVIVNYLIFPGPHFTGGTISEVATGLLADFDVLPAQRNPLDTAQIGATNHGMSDYSRNLVYLRGVNRQWYYPTPTNTAERFRAGIAVPSSSPFTGACVGNNRDNQVGGGPTDGHLYWLLQDIVGVTLGELADTDLYIMVGFDNGQSYGMTGTTWQNSGQQYRSTNFSNYTAILASDTIDALSFLETVDSAAALVNAGTFEGCALCPCRYDPACDGLPTILDVVQIVNGAFRNVVADPAILGIPGTGDDHPNQAGCNFDSRDVDADGVIGVTDLVKIINVVFRSSQITAPNTFVDPCTRWKEWNGTQL